MKIQYLYLKGHSVPWCSAKRIYLVKAVLQIAHTYEHKQDHANADRLKDVSPSPLLDDTTRSGEPQDWKTYK